MASSQSWKSAVQAPGVETSLVDLEQYGDFCSAKAGLTPQAIDVATDFLVEPAGYPWKSSTTSTRSLYQAASRIDPAMMPTATATATACPATAVQYGAGSAAQSTAGPRAAGMLVEIRNALERGGLKMVALRAWDNGFPDAGRAAGSRRLVS